MILFAAKMYFKVVFLANFCRTRNITNLIILEMIFVSIKIYIIFFSREINP